MKPKLMAALAVLVLILSAFSGWSQKGALVGRVVDNSGRALVSAQVTLTQGSTTIAATTAGANGAFSFPNLAPGSYQVKAAFPSFLGTARSVTITASKITKVELRMRAVPVSTQQVIVREQKEHQQQKSKKRVTATMDYMEVQDGDEVNQVVNGTVTNVAPAPSPSTVSGRTGYIYNKDVNAPPPPVYMNPSTETYDHKDENGFRNVSVNPLSTLSVDVDRASYANVRRFINAGQTPPVDAVRVEEMVNYFNYEYPQPRGNDPVSITTELSVCPWNSNHKILHVGLQAKTISTANLPPSNLVFLIDVSGSMGEPNKLPLVQASLRLLVNTLRAQDHVALVVYAGNAGLVLPSTSGANKSTILAAIDRLEAGGSTAGGAGIELAYRIALDNFVQKGNNRVILATDGDFNVGVSNNNDLEALIVKKRASGVFLTVLGYGTGNYKDSYMETLADKGNGNHAYIDNIQEAEKTLVSEFGGTLFTVAKDVKAQIEFNPAYVQSYRLIGYENRLLNNEDFKDDKKDAGDMGSGHTVTIMYEIIPVGVDDKDVRNTDALKYQQPTNINRRSNDDGNGELATIKFRYKQPDGDVSKELVHVIQNSTELIVNASNNLRFASSVALFGMLLTDSQNKGDGTYDRVLALAQSSKGNDDEGYRSEFIRLVKSMQSQSVGKN